MNGRRKFTNLTAVAAVTSLALLASCGEDQPTDPTALATGATAAAKGGNGNGGGGGGSSSPADPVLTYNFQGGVHVMNRDGSNPTLLALGGNPAWVPGGTGTIADPYRISYSDRTLNALTIIDVAIVGGTPQVVGSISHPFPNNPSAGAWSPLGDEFAFDNADLIWIMQVDDGSSRTVYQAPPNHGVAGLAWSPDGRHLVLRESDRDQPLETRYSLKILNIAAGTVVAIDLGTDIKNPLGPDWARTRNAIAFSGSQLKGKRGLPIYVVELEPDGNGSFQSAGPPVQLTLGRWPSWSPDDSEIVFADKRFKIYTIATGSTLNLNVDGGAADWRR